MQRGHGPRRVQRCVQGHCGRVAYAGQRARAGDRPRDDTEAEREDAVVYVFELKKTKQSS